MSGLSEGCMVAIWWPWITIMEVTRWKSGEMGGAQNQNKGHEVTQNFVSKYKVKIKRFDRDHYSNQSNGRNRAQNQNHSQNRFENPQFRVFIWLLRTLCLKVTEPSTWFDEEKWWIRGWKPVNRPQITCEKPQGSAIVEIKSKTVSISLHFLTRLLLHSGHRNER